MEKAPDESPLSGNGCSMERNPLIRLVPAINVGRSVSWRYTMAVVTSCGFVALRMVLGPLIGYDAPFTILTVPIALCAFFGGLGPGLTAVLTTVSLADYFLVPPLYTIGFAHKGWVGSTLLFAISGLIVSVLGDLGRTAVLESADETEVRRVSFDQAQLTEERLRITEDAMAGGVWDWDVPSDQVYWSPGYRRLFDYPMNVEPSRKKWIESVYPGDRQRVLDFLDELFSDKRHLSTVEYRILTGSQRIRWITSYGRVYYDAAGKPKRMVGVNLDVTARRLAEEEIRNDQTKLRLLMQYARVGDWEWNPADGSVRCSPELYEVLGLDPTVPPTFDHLMAYVHPADGSRIRELLDQLQEKPGQDFDFENRFVGTNGVERFLHTRGTVIADETGKIVRLVGITIDLARREKDLVSS